MFSGRKIRMFFFFCNPHVYMPSSVLLNEIQNNIDGIVKKEYYY